MRSSLVLVVNSFALLRSFGACLTPQLSEADFRRSGRDVNVEIQLELASAISNTSVIISPSDASWVNETERYLLNVKPQVQLAVRPGTEEDVAKIVSILLSIPDAFPNHYTSKVRIANNHNIPFYAVSRGHALTSSVGLFNGIEIDLRYLDSIRIDSSNKTVHFGGGVYSDKAVPALWEQGFVTATGGCDCVSVIGPALGGGHGLQEGKHGLTMDHFVNLNVVLADGSTVQVNETSNPDLWWAMRGAGHNFGIVTSYESKIWPDNFKTYYIKTYQFDGSSLEEVVDQVNKFQGNGTLAPPWLAVFGLFTMNNTVSQTAATISWTFYYEGAAADAAPALKPFDDLKPLSVQEMDITYNEINNVVGGQIDSPLCEPNKTRIIGTAGLEVWNATALHAIYDLYNQRIDQHPELSYTRILLEGYAVAGVRSFDPDDSAYPLRGDNLLTYFDLKLNSSDDPLIDFATEWRNQTVALWNEGQPERKPTTYVNYAAGYESLEARYGYEPWRLEKLRDLKAKYDPHNRFAWYNPINPPH
ncbi:hypothetical protein BJ170DRAFT_685647 [Xylariales sp. AK1849]|nr:hypothetical protein BJ170DRAFT_685647 [Xylariales sp. AK1849]